VCMHLIRSVNASSTHMAMPSTNIFESKPWPLFALQYDTPILDPALGLTESECIVRAKNYTLTQANVQGTPPANVWDYCSTGVCNYTLANGTQGTFVSPYAGTHTTSICQMGYSAAVDSNEYVEPAYITGIGQGTAGESSPASVCLCMLWQCVVRRCRYMCLSRYQSAALLLSCLPVHQLALLQLLCLVSSTRKCLGSLSTESPRIWLGSM